MVRSRPDDLTPRLAPSNHATTFNGLATLARAFPGGSDAIASSCQACEQQFVGSSFLEQLNAGGDTVSGPSYTVIETKYDTVVTPYMSAFLAGPKVTNVTLQDQCGVDFVDHVGIIYDAIAVRDVLSALDPAHPTPPVCSPVLPALGGGRGSS